jgi:hypothetical protein
MLQGDYAAQEYAVDDQNEPISENTSPFIPFYKLVLMLIFTLLPNVIFLNLTVAILGDSYEETITTISERCLRE